jgi:hypothetical protein
MGKDGVANQSDATLTSGKAQTPQTISVEEHEKALRDAKSAALADVGRLRAESEKAIKAATAANERLNALMKEREEAELATVRDDPEKLTAFQTRQRARQLESDLATRDTELNDLKARLAVFESREAESQKLTKAQEIAGKLNVDPVRLTNLAKFTNGSPEAIEEIAKALPRADGKVGGDGKSFKADSNASIGGGASWEAVRAAFIKDPTNPTVKAQYLEMKRQRT